MDEILIEEKKYVSSKRAAKMTGYAKDYIGQLCREGRVPARLIGRSWYVLESAIQDHRFGDNEIESKEEIVKVVPPSASIKASTSPSSTWESPRYEAFSEELLPPINRIKDIESTDITAVADDKGNDLEASQRVQDSWKAWFDRFNHVEESVSEQEPVASVPAEEPEKKSVEEPEIEEDTRVNVPIHTISRPFYQPPPEELLPRRSPTKPPSATLKRRKSNNKGVVRTIQIVGISLAVIVVAVAVIGSGYFDEYVLSNSKVRAIAGVVIYNK